MKKIIISSLVVIMVLSVHQIWAQRSPSEKVDRLKTELDLSDDQVTQLEKIFDSKHEEMMTLRSDDDKTKEEKREAMKSFRQSMEKEIEAVLNEDQLTKFQELRKERQGQRGGKGNKMGHHHKFKNGKGKELHAKIKAYKEENIKPVMLEQRAKLEPKISEVDKKTIADLRVEFEKMKAERQARFEGKKQNCEPGSKGEFKGKRGHGTNGVSDEKIKKMKDLVEKYKDAIEPLFAEVAEQREVWKKDMEAIKKATLELEDDETQRGMKQMRGEGGDRMELKRMGRFLLLDPNEKENTSPAQSLIQEVMAFPNPATTATTIEYNVLEDGKVLIELRNKKGKLLKTIKNDYQEKGKHSVTITFDNFQSDLFYVIVKDKNGIATTKNIVRIR